MGPDRHEKAIQVAMEIGCSSLNEFF
ncbi:hypothetical protein B0B39_19005 [Legionella longbeachae]|nr:hypothetical protein B0B39_19005 [Legionella longbeachae]QEY53193.1 hypothetical protein FQU71_06305 [Legionella longbeachae]